MQNRQKLLLVYWLTALIIMSIINLFLMPLMAKKKILQNLM